MFEEQSGDRVARIAPRVLSFLIHFGARNEHIDYGQGRPHDVFSHHDPELVRTPFNARSYNVLPVAMAQRLHFSEEGESGCDKEKGVRW